MTTTCQCPADGFCERFQRTMSSRARQICQGINITRENAAKYRANWDRLAKQSAEHKARYGAPGDELKTLLASLGQQGDGGCGCEDRAAQMNVWGVIGCKAHRTKIIGWLIEAAKKRGISQEEAEAASPWLVDEAIRRAEAKMSPPTGDVAINSLAVITCYFNPQHYERPKANYRRFRDGIESAGVPLYTIELAFDDDEFDIPDAIHVRGTRADHCLWQKERLLNLLIQQVPEQYDAIAWVDADILFTKPDWPQRICEALGRYQVVQPFRMPYHLMPNKRMQAMRPSTAWAWATGKPDALHLNKTHPGFAWAGRADWMRRHGLQEDTITGGGDCLMIKGFTGKHPTTTSSGIIFDSALPAGWKRAVDAWALPLAEEIRGQMGFVDQPIMHLYHGSMANRRYLERWQYLFDYDYDPTTDLQIGANGLWEWTDYAHEHKPQMVKLVRDYFALRKEDE